MKAPHYPMVGSPMKAPDCPHYPRSLTAPEIAAMVGSSPFLIEIGANDGTDTAAFLEAMPQARILAFEPEPRALAHFRCQGDSRVRLVPCAISDRNESRILWQSGGIPDCNTPGEQWYQSSSIVVPKDHLRRSPEITFTRGPIVSCQSLDSFWGDCDFPVDFLWCDAQGSEARVILGGQRILRQTRWAMFEFYDTEVYEHQARLCCLEAMLTDFHLEATYGENALFRNRTL